MSDPSQTPSTPPPSYTPPPPSNFPPMPRNAGAAMGMATGYFGATPPGTLVLHAVILIVLSSLITLIESFFEVRVLSDIIRWVASLLDGLSLVVLVVGAARFIADAFRARG